MPRFFASFDLRGMTPDPHQFVLRQAELRGWSAWVPASDQPNWYRLPSSTLIGEFADSSGALAAFDETVAAASVDMGMQVNVKKLVIGDYGIILFRSDEIVPVHIP